MFYKLCSSLRTAYLSNPLFKSGCKLSFENRDTYIEMTEKAIVLQIEENERLQKQLIKYASKYGAIE